MFRNERARGWLWFAGIVVVAGLIVQAASPPRERSAAEQTEALVAHLPKLREQAQIQQGWLRTRLERVLPQLMRRYGVEMWLVICREYNEDPVF
ncbi:MAG: hypothetical protein K6U02_08175, partial [Firmicutes bacterium]|nr:hypothetical protein [Bacillota bacterium]